MNALALILNEIWIKDCISSGDKAHAFIQYIHIRGKVTTLKRNLEMVVSKKADFTKAPYHNEAVELFTAILKNCE